MVKLVLSSLARVLKQPLHVRSICVSASRNSMNEFFPPTLLKLNRVFTDIERAEEGEKPTIEAAGMDDLTFGRSWEKSDLQALESRALHALWYVLLKERNVCLSADAFYRQFKGTSNLYDARLASVQQSMENLQEVIEQREHAIDTAKTHLWMKRVSNLLGPDFAQELASTYVQFTLPHDEKEKEEMIKFKHDQLFTKELHRRRQPYDLWQMSLEEKQQELSEWEKKFENYNSEEYFAEDDFEPGLEGFLHNIKREDWEELAADPEDMVESRYRREEDRLKIVSRISAKRLPDDVLKELEQLKKWKRKIEGSGGGEISAGQQGDE